MYESRQWRKTALASLIIILFAVVAAGLLIAYRQLVVDNVRAWQFTPSARVVQIRESLQLTPLGQLYFDTSQPVVESADTFNVNCPQSEPNNPVLGCYSNQLIYIYDVKNNKLDGIEETTAAHELLHAAYERMSESERREIDSELLNVYASVKTKELEARMKYYEKNEPGEEANELHAILGTEFKQLGTKLESHYAKYFTNRTAILDYFQQYQGVFMSTTGKLDSLASSINSRTLKVNKKIASYNSDQRSLNKDIDRFKQQVFTNQSELDARYGALTTQQSNLDARLKSVKAELAAIDKLRKEYDTLRKEYEELAKSLNSTLEPVPTLNG